MDIAGVILAGGQNSRMNGIKKLFLEYKGEPFYQRIAKAMKPLKRIYLSVEEKEPYETLNFPLLPDQYPSIGPMGGIYTSLKECREEALLVLPCDTPLVEERLVNALIWEFKAADRPVIAKTGDRLHPLAGIYKKTMLNQLERMIELKDYRMMNLIEATDHSELEGDGFFHMLRNINTMEAYEKLVL